MRPAVAPTPIADRYLRTALIATGGMGEVWRGTDDVLGRTVAIKVLRSEYADNAEFRTRFRAEARAVAAVSHRNVVEVYDYGEQAEDDDRCLAYLVMEYVDGPSVADRISASRVLETASVADLLAQTAAGLAAAHERGLVHRDIKPANLLIAADGTVKIVDFGIARAADAVAMTRTGTVIGTAKFLSPEQAAGQTATAASDLYSLGAVGYTCLAGEPPFSEGNEVSIALAHIERKPPPLPAGVPADLRDLVMRLLAKDPASRPSAAEVMDRAERVAGAASPITATTPMPIAAADAPTATRVLPAPVAATDETHRRHWLLLVAALAAVAVIVGVAAAFGGGGGGVSLPTRVRVPTVVGKQLPAARSALHADGFVVKVNRVDHADTAGGAVLHQSPVGGKTLGHGDTVLLQVATGDVNLERSRYLGKPATQVIAALRSLGVKPTIHDVESGLATGSVVTISPAGQVPVGDAVTLSVAVPRPAPQPKLPPGQAKKVQPPGHAKKAQPPAQAKKAKPPAPGKGADDHG